MAKATTAMIMTIEPNSTRFFACAIFGLSVGATVVVCTKIMELWSTVTETPKFASIVLSSEPSASVVSMEDARAVESWCPEAAKEMTTSKLIVHTYAVD